MTGPVGVGGLNEGWRSCQGTRGSEEMITFTMKALRHDMIIMLH